MIQTRRVEEKKTLVTWYLLLNRRKAANRAVIKRQKIRSATGFGQSRKGRKPK